MITKFCRWWLRDEIATYRSMLHWWIDWSDAKVVKPPHTPTKEFLSRRDSGR